MYRVFMTILMAVAVYPATPAFSQAPVAIVEDVRGAPGVEFMDYVVPGTIIRLKPRDMLVLGYLASCWSETIEGGTVTVGHERSEVEGGNVKRSKVMCNGGRMDLTARQANQSAGISFRDSDDNPQLIYGLSPIFVSTGRAAMLVVRADDPNDHFAAELKVGRGSRQAFYDASTAKISLKVGKVYRASIGSRRVLFKIDPSAKPGRVPMISRLVRFSPPS